MTQTVLLGDVADINSESVGKRYPHSKILYLDTSSVTENSFSELQRFNLSDAPSRAKRIVQDGDIVYSTVRPNLKHFGYIKNPAKNTVASTGFAVVRAKENIDSRYLYYWLAADERTEYLTAIADSQTSTFPAFNPSVLAELRVDLPDLEMQKKIADILGTIDEKIELNRQMNETLEQMGQALFRHYFIDNPEVKKWNVGVVSDLIDIYSGFAFKSTDFDGNGHYGLVTIKNVQDGSFITSCTDHLSDPLPIKTPDYTHLKSGDIILSLTGNVGRVCLVIGSSYLLNQRVAKLEGKNDHQAYAYFLFRSIEMKDRLFGISRGTAQMNLSPVETKQLKISLPPNDTMSRFGDTANEILDMIVKNTEQTQTLTTLRDTLLPRLINRKVKV